MEVINSFFSNIKNKLTNPFFGTLTLILLFHHWELIYSIFIFDEDCNMDDKLLIIQNYLSANVTVKSFLLDVIYAVVIMFVGYLIIVFTRIMVIWIEHNVMPYFTGKIVSKNVVLKTINEEVVKERDENFIKYEEQRDKVREYSKLIDEQQDQIKEKDENISNLNEKIIKKDNQFSEKIDIHQLDLKKLKEDHLLEVDKVKNNLIVDYDLQIQGLENIKNEYENIFLTVETRQFYSDSKEKIPPVISNAVNILIDDNLFTTFIQFVELSKRVKLEKLSASYNKEMLEKFYELGLFYKNILDIDLELTVLGNIIYEYRNIFM
ncbi:hypothetical protein IMCC3317_38440 [Kordia antarctica]|uniref:Uncharacterized protein n=1 Tax=Kordia antarctica TaxID=1218801 RepID=A0A7L4ZPK8_9FLAO|nr:hypothetical protein [Kordia antarctica]QHI38451.1 hypothetical protein IMCC3317_38440 [Kordia antarctica]